MSAVFPRSYSPKYIDFLRSRKCTAEKYGIHIQIGIDTHYIVILEWNNIIAGDFFYAGKKVIALSVYRVRYTHIFGIFLFLFLLKHKNECVPF